jgi:hypothetical protein
MISEKGIECCLVCTLVFMSNIRSTILKDKEVGSKTNEPLRLMIAQVVNTKIK